MIVVIKELTNSFKEIVPESFYLKNHKKKPIYPYLTFNYTGEPLAKNQKGLYIDVDIFDNNGDGKNDIRIEQAMSDLVDFIDDENNTILTDDVFIRFDSIKQNYIPTGSDTLQRRYAQIYCRVDWRKK